MKKDLFDRQEYISLLQKRVGDLKYGYRQNIAVIGDESVGKTSIIFKFLDKFCDVRIVPVYLEIRPGTLQNFVNRFIANLLYNFLLNSQEPLKEDLEFLIERAEKYIPKTTAKIRDILSALGRNKKKKIRNIFTELTCLCETIHQETDKFCILILDEFHHLEDLGIKNFYRDWSKSLILEKNTMYIITSSARHKAKNILSKHLSLLFGNFEVVPVEPFDVKTSQRYLESRLSGYGIKKDALSFIINFTAGSPLYLEIISEEIIKQNTEDLKQVLERILFDASGILHQRFSNYLKRFLDKPNSHDYLSILHLVSGGHNKIREIAQMLQKPRKEILSKVNSLIEMDALTRSGDFLTLNDRVFAFWLKAVYQDKLALPFAFELKDQKNLFRENTESLINEFMANSLKPIGQRITELIRQFENEVIQIEKKKLRLSHFREIKPLQFNGKGLTNGLICRCPDNLWLIAFKTDTVTEDDIAEFACECRKYRHKLQKKIVIALGEVDPNAKLAALEEKILTWDTEHLNQIMDLFYKPRMII